MEALVQRLTPHTTTRMARTRTATGRFQDPDRTPRVAIEGKKEAARLAGVPVDLYQVTTFVIGGLMAGMSGVVYASRCPRQLCAPAEGYDFNANAATAIGGTSAAGGRGARWSVSSSASCPRP